MTKSPTTIDTHHAFVVAGFEETVPEVRKYLSECGLPITHPSSDLMVRVFQSFGIEDARELSTFVDRVPVDLPRRVAIIASIRFTLEAQHALLKTTEEPHGALMVLMTPHPERLLPTLRSRLMPLQFAPTEHEDSAARSFLAAKSDERLEQVQGLIEGARGDTPDFSALITFLHSLERELAPLVITPEGREGIRALYRAERAATEPGAPIKMLFEQLAILLPNPRQ